jgi:hypothetical protein
VRSPGRSLVLLAGLIFGLARRRNWLRLTYLVVFLLLVALSLPKLWLERGEVALLLGLAQGIGLALQIAALVLLFRPRSRAWFRA